MLHIKDIEAFARINEALADESDKTSDKTTHTADTTDAAAHPAMLLAMVATGRLPLSALPKAPPGSGMTLPLGRLLKKP